MLTLKDINAFYGEIQILNGISLHINKGEIIAIIGSNGSGKTTTVSCISRVLESFTGSIEFEGKRIDNVSPDQIVEAGIVQIPEGRLLFPNLTVRENLELGAYNKKSRPFRKSNLEFVYEILPKLKERSSQMAGSLSGGEAQMCAIGRGLMAKPSLLIFDEPSLGLAPIIVLDIMKLIKKIRDEGVTVLLVEQNVKQSLTLADRAYAIANGKIVIEGTGKEMLGSEAVKKAYLGI